MPILKFWFNEKAKIANLENGVSLDIVSQKSDLLRIMACLDQNASVIQLQPTSKAYFSILDVTLTKISNNVIAVVHTNSLTDRSAAGIRQRVYTILCVIAETFKDEKKEVFLGKLCSELVKRDLALDDPKNTAQLVFILFSALTTFYIPIPDPEPGKLQMRASNLGSGIQRRSTATWHIGSQELKDSDLEASFDDLLFRYCRHEYGPIPQPRVRRHNTIHGPPGESKVLRSQNVSFYTLDRLLKVQVCWTTSICEHLEFNLKTKTLKLFRIPSYCVLLCLLEPDKTFLDSLFHKFLGDEREELAASVTAADFFREVLATYRLIFGQHKDSRKLIKAYSTPSQLLGYRSRFRKPHPSSLVKENADPLLERLCFRDSRNEVLFADLDMLNLKDIYVPDVDFPYFAERLWALQEFVENQCPNDWKVVWRDRRDVAKFWALWAVLLFGASALLLSIVQCILIGVQFRGPAGKS